MKAEEHDAPIVQTVPSIDQGVVQPLASRVQCGEPNEVRWDASSIRRLVQPRTSHHQRAAVHVACLSHHRPLPRGGLCAGPW
jgi:hypothetical protein